ncbi:hypothetical protein V2J09_012518 [Rumex salicifolius]
MDLQAVIDFLRKHGLSDAELALKEDIKECRRIGSCDFEKFMFPMNPPLPPVRVPATIRRRRRKDGSFPEMGLVSGPGSGSGSGIDCSDDDEFVSLGSSASGVCNSDFTNPYGHHSATLAESDASSDRMSQFGTAREYHEFDMQTDLWYGEKDEENYLSPRVGLMDPFSDPTEDKFVMTSETKMQSVGEDFDFDHVAEKYQPNGGDDIEDSFHLKRRESMDSFKFDQVKDYFHLDGKSPGITVNGLIVHEKLDEHTLSKDEKQESYSFSTEDESDKFFDGSKESSLLKNNYSFGGSNDKTVFEASQEVSMAADDPEDTTPDEVPFWEAKDDEYEVFDLRIIHRKNRTGFEENKEIPIVINTLIAGRYFVTEYLGSAAFSKVVQAHDIQTGVDVCLKIIKNDKDFFDQSLDEIKLLKYVNKHDPADKHHILRLYDYFYHQEHLFIVCELLRANLYEFQKYNLESDGEPYFTVQRLQVITRQCLEALEFLHGLGIIHCDLKPENILIKSYTRCEVKVIDLGSSCFLTDNLSLYVQSRSYRAPEVILGLPYDPKIDIWSLGCILAELCSGEVLFPNDAVVMLLARVIGLLGPIDLEMLLRGQETNKYFTKELDLYYVDEETEQVELIVPEKSSLERQLPESDALFLDFVKNLLRINPKRRPTAKEALQHPWLLHTY